jgi:hypothetical protein
MLKLAPPNLPDRIWLVVRANGERHFLERDVLGGLAAWAKGSDATVVEYRFTAVVHKPLPKPKKELPKNGR